MTTKFFFSFGSHNFVTIHDFLLNTARIHLKRILITVTRGRRWQKNRPVHSESGEIPTKYIILEHLDFESFLNEPVFHRPSIYAISPGAKKNLHCLCGVVKFWWIKSFLDCRYTRRVWMDRSAIRSVKESFISLMDCVKNSVLRKCWTLSGSEQLNSLCRGISTRN